jgi:coproporphyrinogen III oxidase
MLLENKQKQASLWFEELRDNICRGFIAIENEYKNTSAPASNFILKSWQRPGGGGGEISMMHGRVFEKVGVNISVVHGEFTGKFTEEIPGTEKSREFWAAGISLVAHMQSPLVPAVHMNTRFICTAKSWFGGGTDLTPIYPNQDNNKRFHNSLKAMCERHDPDYYSKFKQKCDEYFYLPHRAEPRGIGGIFYDYLNTGNWQADFNFTQDVGRTFLETHLQIIRNNMYKKWSAEQREFQLKKRGRYVEFNLLYDRGTRFGIMTGGNPDAVLMSLPPLVKW